MTGRRQFAVMIVLAAVAVGPVSTAGAAGPRERVPTHLINRFPLNPEKHKGSSAGLQATHPGAPVTRRADTGTGSPAVWPLLVVGVAGVLVGVLGARLPRERWARVRGGSPAALPVAEPAQNVKPAARAKQPPAARTTRAANGSPAARPSPAVNGSPRKTPSPAANGSPPATSGSPSTTPRQRRAGGSGRRRAPNRARPEVEFESGTELQNHGDLTGAESAFRRADQRGHREAALALGMLLEQRGDRQAAEAAYRRADERGDGVAAANLGVLLEERGDLAGAEAAYRRADERDEATGAYNLGALLAQLGEPADAAAAYGRAAELGDGDLMAMAKQALRGLGKRAR